LSRALYSSPYRTNTTYFNKSSISLGSNAVGECKGTSADIKTAPIPVWNNTSVPKNRALIANGFCQADFNLANTAPPKGSPGYPNTLPDFLQSLLAPSPSEPAHKLVFTGHSLGGALSPSLAYTLLKANALGPFAQKDVYVYPTAGPTAGNKTFVESFGCCFPSPAEPFSGYQHWNCNIVNPLDIVPHAYCMDPTASPGILSEIPTIYGAPDILPHSTQLIYVKDAVFYLEWAANKLYYHIKRSRFDSSIPKPKETPADVHVFLKMAHRQHVDAYTQEILGIPPPRGPCSLTEEEQWSTLPVLGYLWAQHAKAEAVGFKVEAVADETVVE
jgi:hypothetical protein